MPVEFVYSDQIEAQYDLSGETAQQLTQVLALNNPNPDHKDIDYFYVLMQQLIQAILVYYGENTNVIYTHEFPVTEQLKWKEIITTKLLSRHYARVSKSSPTEEENVRAYVPLARMQQIPDPEYPGHTINVYEQGYENIIEFTCWALTNEEANKRALWFENIMTDFAVFFGANGIGKIFYLGRSEDTQKSTQPGDLVHFGCPLNYRVFTSKVYKERLKILKEVILSIRSGVDTASSS